MNAALLPSDPTVSQVFDLFRKAGLGLGSPVHWANSMDLLSRFEASYGTTPVAKLIPFQLAQWVADHPDWKSDWTIGRVIRTIKRPFNWACKLGLIPFNPLHAFSHRKGKRGRPMTDEEFTRIQSRACPDFGRVLRFLRYTGARPCEVHSMCWQDLDMKHGAVTLREHKTARTRSDGAPRIIILCEEALAVIVEISENLAAFRQVSRYRNIFLNSKGRPWTRNAFCLQMRRLRERCGLPADCKLYGLRHRFGTVAAVSGVDILAISQLMGHADTRMTQHYIHLAGNLGYLREAIGKVKAL